MDVYIGSEMGTCAEFKDGEKRREISVVISPIKITMNEAQNELKVITGCNMWRACNNRRCYFSLRARTEPRATKQGQDETP